MELTNNGHDNLFPSPPSLHASSALANPPSAYLSHDDIARRQRHPLMDGYGSSMVPAHHQQSQREHSTTYVPSLVPPGVDPSQVDVRTFYPYQPNEVKHRKRTTRPQLKILEGVYEYDKKPNASLRKKLADELSMTPRGVQVWFQNRRAKEKNLARKAEQARDGGVAVKKPLSLDASAAPESSPAPESSSPTPVSSKPPKTAETVASSRTSPGSTATPPLAPASASSSSSPAGSAAQIESSGSQQDDESPFLQSPPSREASVGPGYLSSTPTPSAADLLALRRPSLPILSLPPSASSSSHPAVRTTRASIHGPSGGSGLLSVPNGQSPHGFDPAMRRRSVDNNIARLKMHPYAHLARGTNDRFHAANPSHLHSLAPSANSDSSSRLDAARSRPEPIGYALRHGSMPHVLDVPGRLQRRASALHEYATNSGFPQGDMGPPRPTLAHKHSLPAFQSTPDFRLSSRSVSTGQPGSLPIFTNPNPFGTSSMSAGSSPPFTYDIPVSPLAPGAQPPPSPSSASPPPISQSLLHSSYSHGMHVPTRIVAEPIPGPLPDASFQFGDPSSSPSMASSAASSPPSDHSTVVDVGPARRDSADSVSSVGNDDGSQSSSAYDSRFGSITSVSSWTSYWSEPSEPHAQKPDSLEAPDNFDPARRGSFASTFLPQLLNGLEVTDAGTQQGQPFANDAPEIPPQIAESRRGSVAQPEPPYNQHMQDVYNGQNVYIHDQAGYSQPEHHMPYPSTNEDVYAQNGDVYGQMGKNDVQQHVDAHGNFEMQPMCSSSSSELAYALHPQGNVQSNGQSRFSVSYGDSAGQGNSHPPNAPEQSPQFNPPSSAKAAHYGQETYEQQATSYGSFPQDQQVAYQEQQQPAYSEHPGSYQEQQLPYFPYGGYQGTAMNNTGAVDLGSMCVPTSLMIGGLDYGQQYS